MNTKTLREMKADEIKKLELRKKLYGAAAVLCFIGFIAFMVLHQKADHELKLMRLDYDRLDQLPLAE